MITQSFSQTGQIIGLCCENLSVRCIRLYFIMMSLTGFGENPHDITITHRQTARTDKYSQHSSIIWSIWLND